MLLPPLIQSALACFCSCPAGIAANDDAAAANFWPLISREDAKGERAGENFNRRGRAITGFSLFLLNPPLLLLLARSVSGQLRNRQFFHLSRVCTSSRIRSATINPCCSCSSSSTIQGPLDWPLSTTTKLASHRPPGSADLLATWLTLLTWWHSAHLTSCISDDKQANKQTPNTV